VATQLSAWAHRRADTYRQGADRPLAGYLATMGVYGAAVGTLAGLAKAGGRTLPDRVDSHDLVLLAVATHKASRLLAKDPVTSPLRAPFTRFQGRSGESELAEAPRDGTGAHTVGELLTCPFCVSQWVATGFAFGLVLAPRTTRFAAALMAVRAGSDALQFGYDLLQRSASGG
jgi:hypothetical protein